MSISSVTYYASKLHNQLHNHDTYSVSPIQPLTKVLYVHMYMCTCTCTVCMILIIYAKHYVKLLELLNDVMEHT